MREREREEREEKYIYRREEISWFIPVLLHLLYTISISTARKSEMQKLQTASLFTTKQF
jgi:hypothetical protein